MSGLSQLSQGYKFLSVTKTGQRPKFKWLGDLEELKLFVSAYLKITGTWSFTTNNGGFHTMKAEGASINFCPGTKTLGVQGSKSEIVGQKLLQFTCTGNEAHSHIAASNIQTNFGSDSDREQPDGGEEHETTTSDEITEDLNVHSECSKLRDAVIPEVRLEVGKLRFEFSELKNSNLSTARSSDETRLQAENRDLKKRLYELEKQYDSLKRESKTIQYENRSLLTAIRLLNETKDTDQDANIQEYSSSPWELVEVKKKNNTQASHSKENSALDTKRKRSQAAPQPQQSSSDLNSDQVSTNKPVVVIARRSPRVRKSKLWLKHSVEPPLKTCLTTSNPQLNITLKKFYFM